MQKAFPNVDDKTLAWAMNVAVHPPTGTINCLALNSKGEMSGVTTTAGRVGDSPIIGAGLYVDQDVGAAGSTGRGEENIRIAGAHTVVENMRHGMTPKEAGLDRLAGRPMVPRKVEWKSRQRIYFHIHAARWK